MHELYPDIKDVYTLNFQCSELETSSLFTEERVRARKEQTSVQGPSLKTIVTVI